MRNSRATSRKRSHACAELFSHHCIFAVHRIDPVGVDFFQLMADPFDVQRRKRPEQAERAIDHPPDISLESVVLKFAQYLADLRRKAADRSKVDEANLVVGHDDKVCRMRIGMEEQLLLDLALHDDHNLARQRSWLNS